MNCKWALILAAVACGVNAHLTRASEIPEKDARRHNFTYHADIAPLFQKHCLDCHGVDQADANFRVDSYEYLIKGGDEAGPAVLASKPDESPLVEYLTGKRLPRMPKMRKALSEDEISLVRAWIEQGAIKGTPQPNASFSEEQLMFFETNIRPLFVRSCMECHGTDKANGNLAFLSREDLLRGGTQGPAIVPGKPEESLLIAAVEHRGKLRMPKSRRQLESDSIALLKEWIAMDAPWPATNVKDAPKIRTKFVIYDSDREHWAFQPVARPELPQVENASWPSDDIDQFILARLEAENLAPAPQASRDALMRRLSFDLTGLPPAPEDQTSDIAIPGYVDKLLASEAFGNHWARHWLDNIRYRPGQKKSESNDPYGMWVAKAFNEDMPYDQFLKMQIAGDLLPADNPDEVHLDGLIAVRPWSLKSRHEQQIDLLGRTFLGMSLYCARCHDHKLEPVSREDYFAVKGIFESSQVVQVPLLKEKSRYEEYMAGLQQTQSNETRMKKELKKFSSLAALVDLRARLASERQKLNDPKQDQKKVQANIDKLMADENKRLADIKKKEIDLDAPEADEYMRLRQQNREFEEQWKEIYQLDAFVDQSDASKIGDAAPPKLGADPDFDEPKTDPPVPRRFPTILAGVDQTPLSELTSQSGRVELANWLADGQHPITSRLITNRIWYYLLGEGLVPSLSNFGRSGRAPTHPKLLDYLSDELVRHDWSMKQLIRRIVLSSTYQQTSTMDVSRAERDQRLQLFGMARSKRLEVESILRTISWLEHDPQSSDRFREPSIDMVNEMRLLFDGADRNLIVPRRTSSVSPLQALFLMNSEHLRNSTERIAARLYSLPDEQRISQAFLLLYGRDATPEEIEAGKTFLANWNPGEVGESKNAKDVPPEDLARWQAYVQVLLLANEFMYVD